MNLGQAVAVCLYEICRRPVKSEHPKRFKPADAGEIEQITRMLIEAGRKSGYVNPVVGTSTENKVRRMVRRLHLTGRDVSMWLGIHVNLLIAATLYMLVTVPAHALARGGVARPAAAT